MPGHKKSKETAILCRFDQTFGLRVRVAVMVRLRVLDEDRVLVALPLRVGAA